jgi:hypothetical protein
LPIASDEKGRCRMHGGASGSGGPPGERNGQYRHGERTKAAIAEWQKFSALLKMLRAGFRRMRHVETCATVPVGVAGAAADL